MSSAHVIILRTRTTKTKERQNDNINVRILNSLKKDKMNDKRMLKRMIKGGKQNDNKMR